MLLFTVTQAKPVVIVSAYPIYDFVSVIAKDEVSLILLLPPNSDPHSFEPTPKDIVNIGNADIFFYISPEFEPWAQRFVKKAKSAIFVADKKHEDHYDNDKERHDPHVWLDPEEVVEIVEIIAENLKNILPENADFFEKNAKNLLTQINDLDMEYKIKFERCEHRKVFFTGHNSFVGFAKRYGLQIIPITQSFSSTSEPSAKQIAIIIDEIHKSGAKFIYYDVHSGISAAKTIAKETQTQILPLFTIHTTSRDDFAKKVHYIEYMKRNYENLLRGLQF
jgi:zinc transport system substrate-binding protein